MEQISSQIKTIIKNTGLNHDVIAEKMGISCVTLSHWKNGKVTPTIKNIEKYFDYKVFINQKEVSYQNALDILCRGKMNGINKLQNLAEVKHISFDIQVFGVKIDKENLYKINVDDINDCSFTSSNIPAKQILEYIGEEPNDCVLVAEKNGKHFVFKGVVDITKYKKFKTLHSSFIQQDWEVVY